MAKIRVEFENIDPGSKEIEQAILRGMEEAVRLNIEIVECNPGKISDDLHKRVVHFLEKPDIRKRYYKLEKGGRYSGKLFILFRHKNERGFHG